MNNQFSFGNAANHQMDLIEFYNKIRPDGDCWAKNIIFGRFIKLYRFAIEVSKDYCQRSDPVLDAASGLGYGSMLLNTYFNHVDGVDISKDAVSFAKNKFSGPSFIRGNVLDLPFDSNSFQAVFSIETLEHLPRHEHKKYINELIRVTKRGGLIFISTPNKPVYSSLHIVEEHIGELNFFEMKSLLREHCALSDIVYYQFGKSVGRNVNNLNRIEKCFPFLRKIIKKFFGMPFPKNITLDESIDFWDISVVSNEDNSLGYLNIAIIFDLDK